MRLPDEYQVLETLRDTPARLVLRVRYRGEDAVTRVLRTERLHPNQVGLVQRIVLRGRGSLVGVPESIALTLEGYRVAAGLSRDARLGGEDGLRPLWPLALDAGITGDRYVYVTTTWMPGRPAHALAPAELLRHREGLTIGVLDILRRLHAEHVAYGDLKTQNVVVGDTGATALIDLDTLRQVPDDVTAVVTRDLTRHWAAPEQERGQQTFLASDLWAWARLVRELHPEGHPHAGLLASCQLGEPLRRPHTAAVWGHLAGAESPLVDWRGEPVGRPSTSASPSAPEGESLGTERVEEAPVHGTERVEEGPVQGTERVDDAPDRPRPTLSPAPGAPSPPAPRRAGSGCLPLLFYAGALVTLFGVGLAAWGLYEYTAAAGDRVAALENALRSYKTDRVANAEREALLDHTRSRLFQYNPPRWVALASLARSWAAGWQDLNRRWEASDERLATELLAAVDGNNQPEARLAAGTAHAAWCRLADRDLAQASHCEAALQSLASFRAVVPEGPALDWLRVEAAWTEVLVRSHLAAIALKDGGDPGLTAADGLARCDEAMFWLPAAPVNDRELVEDCVVLAGLAQDLPHFQGYASWLLADDGPTPRERTESHLYLNAAPGCANAKFRRKGSSWTQSSGDPWCLAVGHYARGCVPESLAVIERNGHTDPSHPWATLRELVIRVHRTRDCSP